MTKQNIGTVTFMQLAAYDCGDESPLDSLRTSARADMYAAMMFRPVYPVPSDVIVFRNDKTASTEAWLVTEDGLEKLHGFWKLH